jgi:type IV pilus assembly protein PilM
MAVHQPGVWGIDLGQCALKAIRLEMIDGEVTATAFDYIEHPKILSQPDADPDQLTREALDKFLSRNTLRGDMVVISVPGQSGLARFVKLPPVEEKKIADIVRFEAKQQIPFPLDEVVWDYQKLSAGVVTDGFALETEIGLFAMKRDMVNRYLQHFQDVNVEVHVVQMAPLALCNFVSHDLLNKAAEGTSSAEDEETEEEDDETSGKKQCIVALDIGTDNSNLVITDGEKIIWQRPIPIGGNHFTRALTKDLKLTFAKAEHLKRNAVKSPDLKKILAALRPVLNDFVSEVQRSLGYFTNTHRDAHIKFMVGLGNAFRLPGLQKFLQEKLQLEVRKLSGFKRLTGESVSTAPQFTENVLSFAVAYGLGLQGLNLTRLHTNLLPHEIRVERLVRAKKPWAAAAAAILLVGIAGLAYGRARQYAAFVNPRVDAALKEGEKAKKEADDYASKYDEIMKEAKDSREAFLKMTGGIQERFNWNLLYQYIGAALPRPDGSHLPASTVRGRNPRSLYLAEGKKAMERLRKRRAEAAAATSETPSADDLKEEKEIKERLIQINIEGIVSLYADDFGQYYKKLNELKKNLSLGMRTSEAELIKKGSSDGLPKKGWLVEIRGSTEHRAGVDFIVDTLVENLANPKEAGIKLSPDLKKKVRGQIKCVFLYTSEVDKNPQPGSLRFLTTSRLPEVLGAVGAGGGKDGSPEGPKGPMPSGPGAGKSGSGKPMAEQAKEGEGPAAPAAADRSKWHPLGEIASVVLSGGGTSFQGKNSSARPSTGSAKGPPGINPGARPAESSGEPEEGEATPSRRVHLPRTEFVIFFIWDEQLPSDGSAPPAANPPPG